MDAIAFHLRYCLLYFSSQPTRCFSNFAKMPAQEMKGNNPKYHPGRALREPVRCSETGSGFIMGGPFWAGPLHDTAFVTELLASIEVGNLRRTSLSSFKIFCAQTFPSLERIFPSFVFNHSYLGGYAFKTSSGQASKGFFRQCKGILTSPSQTLGSQVNKSMLLPQHCTFSAVKT